MRFIKTFEKHSNNSILIVVDVQKSFRSFFTEMYIHKLKEYCKEFSNVYQIWDNHSHGKNVDKDYLYDHVPDIPVSDDLYQFPNQTELIEKRYNYDVDVDFYKKILDKEVYNEIKQKEENKTIKVGELFKTNEGTAIVYIGNNHKWFHLPVKLYNLFLELRGKKVIVVGGADLECTEDICISGESMGVEMKRNYKYIYSANHCPL
jgi:hypothetical protein